MRKVKNLIFLLISCVALSACGGGGDGDGSPNLLKGYYKDSAVIGLPYKCGAQTDVTGSQGEFFFMAGDSCEFFLDSSMQHLLRTVPASVLSDNVVITETNPLIGQTLQSLDSDGNPGNGINIDSALVEAVIADPSFQGVPTNESEADALAALIDTKNGSIGVVTSEEAKEHMLETLLTNRSFYQHCSGRIDEKAVTKIDFVNGNISLNDTADPTAYSLAGGNLSVTPPSSSARTFSVNSNSNGLIASNEAVVISDSNGAIATLHTDADAAKSADQETCAFGDIIPPVITLNGSATETVLINTVYQDPGASVTDAVDEDLTTANSDSSTAVNMSVADTYTVTYSVTDLAGNVATPVTRTVTVLDAIAFTIPSVYYEYYGYPKYGTNINEHEAYKIELADRTSATVTEKEVMSGSFHDDVFESATYELKDGAWSPLRYKSSSSIQLSVLDTEISADDSYKMTLVDKEDISNQSREIDGVNAMVSMPADAEKVTLKRVRTSGAYRIFGVHQPDVQNFDQAVQNVCGNYYFSVGGPELEFASIVCPQAGETSGTLIGEKADGTIVQNVGTWEISQLPNSTIDAIVTSVDATYSPNRHGIFVLQGTELWYGSKYETGATFELVAYNQAAFDAISAAAIAELKFAGTDEFQVVNGKLSLKSVATAVYDLDTEANRNTQSNRYGYRNSDPEADEGSIESFEADVNLVAAQTTVNTSDVGYSTRSRAGIIHGVYSQSSGYRSYVDVFLEHGTNGSGTTIFKAWHSIWDEDWNQVSEVSLGEIHSQPANLDTPYKFKVETIEGGWRYTVGPHVSTILASSMDFNGDGTGESVDDFLTRDARFTNYVRYPTALGDSSEATFDNMKYVAKSAVGDTITVTQDFDRYADGERPTVDDLFNYIYVYGQDRVSARKPLQALDLNDRVERR